MKANYILQAVFLLSTLISTAAFAQSPTYTITGKITMEDRKQAIEFATVMLLDKESRDAITGTTTDSEGNFTISSSSAKVVLEIRFIGFESLSLEEIVFTENTANLGVIPLKEQVQTLDEVEIRAEKSQTEFKLDKRIFNVGRDLSSTGASALEVLNNVPSVNVNIEGQISLRGSNGVQILINGKPSVLASEEGNALGTITADMIDRVEVITNPSAKYDAEGTSGIINIVLKKEDRKGVNGSVTVNTGIPNNHSLGLSLNRRTEKFNLFTQMGIGRRTFPDEIEMVNENLQTGITTSSEGESEKNETFYNLILGTDYHINKYNVLSLTGHFAYEKELELFDANFQQLASWRREEETRATNPKYQYEFQYKKEFRDDEDHMLLISALGDFFGKDQSSSFVNTAIIGTVPFGDQETRNDFQEAEYLFKIDYTHPFKKKFTIETGAQYILSDVGNDFGVNEFIDGVWVPDLNLTNNFEFNQNVLGVYGTAAYEGKKWGLKLGLRLENTDLSTLLEQTNQSNSRNYTNLFPSAHTSYKISDLVSLQAGYSRRIFRPNMWLLNPFFNVRNNFNIRTGNPDLDPEFTDSYELTSIFVFEKFSLNVGAYYRYTIDIIERVPLFDGIVTTTKPLNIGTDQTTGLEVNFKFSPASWLTVNGDANFQYFSQEGEINDTTDVDFSARQGFGKLTTKVKLPADFEVEVMGNYQSGYRTLLGDISPMIFANIGVRKKIMKGRGVFNLSIRDIFASRISERNINQPGFQLYNRSLRGRFVTIGFSYGFGKGEAMQFSGQKRF